MCMYMSTLWVDQNILTFIWHLKGFCDCISKCSLFSAPLFFILTPWRWAGNYWASLIFTVNRWNIHTLFYPYHNCIASFSNSLSIILPYWSSRLACATRCCGCKCGWPLLTLTFLALAALRAPPEVAFAMRSWPLLLPTFSLSFFLSLFSVFCFWPTSGIPRKLKFYGPS